MRRMVCRVSCVCGLLALAAGCASRLERSLGLLQAPDYQDRCRGAGELGRLAQRIPAAKVAPVISSLVKALGDEHFEVRKASAAALGTIGGWSKQLPPMEVDGLASALLKACGDKRPDVRAESMRALGDVARTHPERIVPVLTDLLQREDAETCVAAAQALGSLGGKAEGSVGALAPLLQDKRPQVSLHAAAALASVAPESTQARNALGLLLACLPDETAAGRDVAARAIGHLAKADGIPPAQRPQALDALIQAVRQGIHKPAEALPATKPPSPTRGELAIVALTALGNMGDKARKSLPVVIQALKCTYVRRYEGPGLALGSVPPEARITGWVSLDARGGIVAANLGAVSHVAATAAATLARIGDASHPVLTALHEAGRSPDAMLRRAAEQAFEALSKAAMRPRD